MTPEDERYARLKKQIGWNCTGMDAAWALGIVVLIGIMIWMLQ